MRRTSVGVLVALLLAGVVLAAPPTVKIPAEVKPAGQYVTVTPEGDAVSVSYVGLSGIDPLPSAILKDARMFVLDTRGLLAGRYKFAAIGAGKDGEQARTDFTVIVGDPPPGPGPGPDPPKPPDPPVPPPGPAPISGKRVLIVYESADVTKMPAKQQDVLFSRQPRDYLNSVCEAGPDGKTKEWRIWDKDVALDGTEEVWKNAMTRQAEGLGERKIGKRTALPWLVIGGKNGGYEGPLPGTVEEFLALLKKHLGD